MLELDLSRVAMQLEDYGYQHQFIRRAVDVGLKYEGVADLLRLWEAETVDIERFLILNDISDMVKEVEKHKETKDE